MLTLVPNELAGCRCLSRDASRALLSASKYSSAASQAETCAAARARVGSDPSADD